MTTNPFSKCLRVLSASIGYFGLLSCVFAVTGAIADTNPALSWSDVSVKSPLSTPPMQPLGTSNVIPSPPPPTVQSIPPSSGIPPQKPFFVKEITASGTMSSTTLSIEISPELVPSAPVMVFFGANVPARYNPSEIRTPLFAYDTWYINDGNAWGRFSGGVIPPFLRNLNASLTHIVNLLGDMPLINYCGIELYAGIGNDQDEMLSSGRLGKVFTVPCPYSFTGEASGTMSDLTLVAHVKVSQEDAGRTGSYYVARNAPDSSGDHWFFHNGTQWLAYTGGAFFPYATGALADRDIVVMNHENATALSGITYYVGYAQNPDELLSSHKYGEIYKLP